MEHYAALHGRMATLQGMGKELQREKSELWADTAVKYDERDDEG